MPRSSFASSTGGGVVVRFDSQKMLQHVDRALLQAGNRILASAKAYWRDEEWTPDRHPEMTGEERDKGFFELEVQEGHRVRLVMGSSARHANVEEYGSIHRPGHFPVRQTLDTVTPRVAPIMRRAIKRAMKAKR
jgi:hypothetical protein